MRYPRTVFAFDAPANGVDEHYFQMISASTQKIYIKGLSKPVRTLDHEINLIRILDDYLNFTGPDRTYMALGNIKEVEFLAMAMSDKNCSIYWLIDKNSSIYIQGALDALLDLYAMEEDLSDAL
jgi:hypothetical protein